MTWQVINGNNIDILKQYPDNHFDSIVTDPPYGIEFLGKDWDKNTGALETWQECLRVLKPGGYLLAFSAARTYHHLATNIESVGFEIRDQLMWIYSSGFPKAQDIGKAIDKRNGINPSEGKTVKCYDNQITAPEGEDRIIKGMCMLRCAVCNRELATFKDKQKPCERIDCPDPWTPNKNNEYYGWKTALKPAHEPIVMARKPFKGSCVDNVMEWGTGALNIDESRIPADDVDNVKAFGSMPSNKSDDEKGFTRPWMNDKQSILDKQNAAIEKLKELGRYPSNVMGEIPEYQKFFFNPEPDKPAHEPIVMARKPFKGSCVDNVMEWGTGALNIDESRIPYEDDTDANNMLSFKKYNNSLNEKDNSIYGIQALKKGEINDDGRYPSNVMGDIPEYQKYFYCPKVGRKERMEGNNHPTVKPVELMKYLIRLVTPKGGIVLDPFNGSGSTGMGAVELGMSYVGCELDPDYVEIAQKRIAAWEKKFDNPINNLFDIDE